MLSLRIEYLTGRAVATRYNDRDVAEWPPHPARVMSALVAAWAEDDQLPSEREALDWLCAQPPPAISASAATRRAVMTHFVPVNDTAVLRTFEAQRQKIAKLKQSMKETESALKTAVLEKDNASTRRLEKLLAKLAQTLQVREAALAADQHHDQMSVSAVSAVALAQASALLPEHRGRQARTFPSVSPLDPVVYLMWDVEPSEAMRSALDRVARRVVRLGHSSSLVSCCVERATSLATLVPKEDGTEVLRVTSEGQVDRLINAYFRHGGVEPRVLPSRFQRYGPPEKSSEQTCTSVFSDEWIVLRQIEGPRMASTITAEVAQALRAALMSYAREPIPEILSGHRADGAASEIPHVAIVPLPFVGSAHATGLIMGAAIILPRTGSAESRLSVIEALALWEQNAREKLDDDSVESPPLGLRLGSRGVIELERVVWGVAPLTTLRSRTWCRASRRWMSATPVALDRNPGNLFSRDVAVAEKAYAEAEESITQSCQRVGLPIPKRVEVLPSIPMAAVAKARAFLPFPLNPERPRRVKVHAAIEFVEPVSGPVILGAGRYLGLGLFRPVDSESGDGE